MYLQPLEQRTLLNASLSTDSPESDSDEPSTSDTESPLYLAETSDGHNATNTTNHHPTKKSESDGPSTSDLIATIAIHTFIISFITASSYLTGKQAARMTLPKIFRVYFENNEAYRLNESLPKQLLFLATGTIGAIVPLVYFYAPWTNTNLYAKVIAWPAAVMGFNAGFFPMLLHTCYKSFSTGAIFGQIEPIRSDAEAIEMQRIQMEELNNRGGLPTGDDPSALPSATSVTEALIPTET